MGIKGHLWNTSSSFFSKRTPAGMPEAWPRDAASRSQFSGNHGYMCNLRRSLSKGTLCCVLKRLLMGMLYQCHHAEGKSVQIAGFLSHRLEEHHPCPADLESKNLSTGNLKTQHHRLAHQSMALCERRCGKGASCVLSLLSTVFTVKYIFFIMIYINKNLNMNINIRN